VQVRLEERLKNPPGPGQTDYFDELLERIRDIRASERRFSSRNRAPPVAAGAQAPVPRCGG